MDENGDAVPANEHDILTGSDSDGPWFIGENDDPNACEEWTASDGAPGPRAGTGTFARSVRPLVEQRSHRAGM